MTSHSVMSYLCLLNSTSVQYQYYSHTVPACMMYKPITSTSDILV